MPVLLERIPSKEDATIKFIFQTDNNYIFEMAYINKGDGKDIICVSTHTACDLACRFCHTTETIGKINVREIKEDELMFGIDYINTNLHLNNKESLLLISFMGCGEPMLNYFNVFNTMQSVYIKYPNSRFAFATLIPKNDWVNLFNFTSMATAAELPIKMHLSLHFTDDKLRNKWMPNAANVREAVAALEFFKNVSPKHSAEVHYALISGVNDSLEDAYALKALLDGRNIPVKFLKYNEKGSISAASSNVNRYENFKTILNKYNINTEYYIPPGIDVGASCGQFLLDYYYKYNGG